MLEFIKKIYRKYKKNYALFISVNWIKTLYFNYKKFPYHIAKKLPVYFYGRVKLSCISGEIIIEAPIKTAMIGFGQKFEKMTKSKGISEISIAGKLVFKGYAHLGLDCFLYVEKKAYCEFGNMSCLGSNVKLICTKKIILGDWAGIGYESQIIDTNSHPMKNSKTGEYYSLENSISIGNHNAISNRVSLMGGTITPDFCVIASNTLCNKDYSHLGENILIGGIPAKLIKNDYTRDWEKEKELLKKYKIVKW